MILLMTTAPQLNSAWIHGRRLPPLGIAYIAANLEKAGFEVQILDNYLLEKPVGEIKQIIKKFNPEIVGIACSAATYGRCIETAKSIKEVSPSCKIVAGGPHPSCMPESMLQHPEIDYVVLGEAEQAMLDLSIKITKGEESSIANISGIAFKAKGKIVRNAQKFINDLDNVPFPARHLLPMDLYGREIEYLDVAPVDTMNVVRGCPYSCAYCDVQEIWGHQCRAFSPVRVVAEIEHMVKNYGSKGIYFVGDNFTINKKRTIELCRLMKEHKLDIEWVCDTRVDLLSHELLNEMKDAGCRTIWFGVESGSPRILEKISRGVDLQQVESAFKLCRNEGIRIACSFLIGIPGETISDMKSSLKFAKKLNPDWCRFNTFLSYPTNKLYNEIMQNRLYDRIEDFVVYVKTADFDFESVTKIQRQFHKSFNKSPKRILRKIRRDGLLCTIRGASAMFPRT